MNIRLFRLFAKIAQTRACGTVDVLQIVAKAVFGAETIAQTLPFRIVVDLLLFNLLYSNFTTNRMAYNKSTTAFQFTSPIHCVRRLSVESHANYTS